MARVYLGTIEHLTRHAVPLLHRSKIGEGYAELLQELAVMQKANPTIKWVIVLILRNLITNTRMAMSIDTSQDYANAEASMYTGLTNRESYRIVMDYNFDDEQLNFTGAYAKAIKLGH